MPFPLLNSIAIFVLCLGLMACESTTDESSKNKAFTNREPFPNFPSELLPDSLLVHRGILSNNGKSYYLTVSTPTFTEFSILHSRYTDSGWSSPQKAWFDSPYDDHGMSFSPDGKTLVFSSTRPVPNSAVPQTWHLWTSSFVAGNWSEPRYLEIPNLKDKLLSHPTIAPEGTLYFHASELDYSNMALYYASPTDGEYSEAKPLTFITMDAAGYCTPYVSASGQYLLFAAISETLDLYVCSKTGANEWSEPKPLPEAINTHGQGNPYLTPDEQWLYFAMENKGSDRWTIKRVSTEAFLKP